MKREGIFTNVLMSIGGTELSAATLGSKQDQTKSYENRAFDEFIIWERALTPDEIAMYFTAAIGQ